MGFMEVFYLEFEWRRKFYKYVFIGKKYIMFILNKNCNIDDIFNMVVDFKKL